VAIFSGFIVSGVPVASAEGRRFMIEIVLK